MERPLDNYQLVVFRYVGDERREQVVSVRDLAHAMRAILGYDSESSLLVRSVDWETEAELNLAGLVRYRDALRRIVDELGVPRPDTPAPVSNAYAIAHFALSGANSAEETERLVANAD